MKKRKTLIILLSIALILFLSVCLMSIRGNVEASPAFNSAEFEKKIKTAITGNGVIEITQDEASGIASSALKSKGVEKALVNFTGNNIKLQMLAHKLGLKVYISTMMHPYMKNGNMYIKAEKLYIGKMPVPAGAALYFAKKYLPKSIKILPGAVLDIGKGIWKIEVKDMYIKDGNFYIVLNEDASGSNAQANVSAPSPTPIPSSSKAGTSSASSGTTKPGQNSSTTSKSGTSSTPDFRAEALKKTNSELYGVLGGVPSSQGKNWVSQVISVNTKMMNNPKGNYSSLISSAKKEYSTLPGSVRSEIKKAALENLDISSVKLLITSYGI